jgi:predicted  nucleic acid-binding Zn-ribbon protein
MGPTNVALVRLLRADTELRQAKERLEAATKNVRIRQRRVNDLRERLQSAQDTLKQDQARNGELDLDLKSREAHIEKLRTQQQNAKNNKEYQAFLIEINTEKVDRAKVEDQALAAMQAVEQGQTTVADLTTQLENAQKELADLESQLGDRIRQLQSEIDALQPARDEAAQAVPARALQVFDRLADRYEGHAMSALAKPNPKREEYICSECNMALVVDLYNRLHVRDELVSCPSCQRILYIPEDLPPEQAVNQKKEPKPKAPRKAESEEVPAAAPQRQSSAADVLASMQPDEEAGS